MFAAGLRLSHVRSLLHKQRSMPIFPQRSATDRRKIGKEYTCGEILEGLREYQFADVQGQGFMPICTKTKLTDKLHEISGFSTDFEFLTKSKMREIEKKSKGK